MALSKGRMRLLRSLRLRKRRDKEGKFLIEGQRILSEALASGAPLDCLVFRVGAGPTVLHLAAEAERRGIETIEADPEEISAISSTPSPQGVIAVARRVPSRWEEWLEGEEDLLFLDAVQDPGNMGTLIRLARAFGLGGVLVGKGSVDPLHPKAIRAAAGAHFRIGVSQHLDPISCLSRVRDSGFPIVVADPEGGAPFERAEYPPKQVLVLGNEGGGVGPEVRSLADLTVRIPLMEGTESINVAVASGILLYHVSRRASRPGPPADPLTVDSPT